MSAVTAAPTLRSYRESALAMDTLVTAEAVHDGPPEPAQRAVRAALGWFREVEACANRFDPASELRRLCATVDEPVPVSSMLVCMLEFALAVARETGGAFDPTVGRRMEAAGFDRDYRSGLPTPAGGASAGGASFRDVAVDPEAMTVRLARPLLLDLGAVAKGFAIDLALGELAPFAGGAISAGGDIGLRGVNPAGEPWRIGIRNPRAADELLALLTMSDAAVCTSGDDQRPAPGGAGHHILDPRTGRSAQALASVTVVAPTAMAADALATAAFVLGPREGTALLEHSGAEGLLVSGSLEIHRTAGFTRFEA